MWLCWTLPRKRWRSLSQDKPVREAGLLCSGHGRCLRTKTIWISSLSIILYSKKKSKHGIWHPFTKNMVVDTHLYFLLWLCPCKLFQLSHQDDECFLWVTAMPLRPRNASSYLSAWKECSTAQPGEFLLTWLVSQDCLIQARQNGASGTLTKCFALKT